MIDTVATKAESEARCAPYARDTDVVEEIRAWRVEPGPITTVTGVGIGIRVGSLVIGPLYTSVVHDSVRFQVCPACRVTAGTKTSEITVVIMWPAVASPCGSAMVVPVEIAATQSSRRAMRIIVLNVNTNWKIWD